MVDPEILEARTLHVLHHLGRLRAQSETTAETFAGDETLWNATLMDLQQAVSVIRNDLEDIEAFLRALAEA